ncbi:helix-turn-helix domain-containing protein [Aquabacterium sp. OR-4]|uniref:helix-turn-helix domain-containing protein n=1 Tax=Aquabacterium sp. OR-4 TaxID=2978127 RepID=UPI0028C6C028|nr:AraC family transcriptional regulator [Aquabacterium sp. OR-4]MDT7835981.1 AraC family transcriptional regulator [Aquabacterium sp. OR-4]
MGLLAWRLAHVPGQTATRLGLAMCIGAAAYALQAPQAALAAQGQLLPWQWPLQALMNGNPVVMWLLACALFDDAFRLRPWHGLLWLAWVLMSVGNCVFWRQPALGWLAASGPIVFSLAALWPMLRSWRGDLVEQRMHWRLRILVVTLGYSVLAALAGIPASTVPLSAGVGLLDAAALLGVGGVVAAAVLDLRAGFWIVPEVSTARAGMPQSPGSGMPQPPGGGGAAAPVATAMTRGVVMPGASDAVVGLAAPAPAQSLAPDATAAVVATAVGATTAVGAATATATAAAAIASMANPADRAVPGADGSALAPATVADPGALARLLRAMQQEQIYRREGLTIGGLAAHLGLPEYRLRRVINGQLGHRNFNAYLNGHRIAWARAALADPARAATPVLTLALEAGFQSLGPFNRAFKADTGLTPTEFRAQALAGEGGACEPG